jgi:DNA-binding MarR family transcriptional regulator
MADHPSPGYDPPARLRRLPSWLTNQVGRQADALVAAALGQEGARRQHFSVLTSLAEQGSASQAELGRRLSIDRSDLHAILNELEAADLVRRVRDGHDRRRNVVELTEAGAARRERLDELIETAQAQLLAPLSTSEQREFRRLLQKLT